MNRRVPLALLLLASLAAGCVHDNWTPPTPIPTRDTWEAFNATNAWTWVEKQVRYPNGTPHYRIPGTPGNTEAATDFVHALTGLGWEAGLQNFTAQYRCNLTPMHNVVATLPGKSNATVILGAHYDSRPYADQDPDPARRTQPVLGANDGASGVAVLLEVARVLAARDNNLTYRILLFDGEDGGVYYGTTTPDPSCSRWAIGSRHYATQMSTDEVARTRLMVLLDMVGDTDLTLRRERHSAVGTHRPYQDLLWNTAWGRGHMQFKNELGSSVEDDHLPFQDRQIPAVDVVHLDTGGHSVFPDSWHTSFDDPAHMSPGSLHAVGDTLVYTLAELDARPALRT